VLFRSEFWDGSGVLCCMCMDSTFLGVNMRPLLILFATYSNALNPSNVVLSIMAFDIIVTYLASCVAIYAYETYSGGKKKK